MLDTRWALLSLLAVTLALIIIYLRYDRRGASAKEVALIATLAALGRIPFAAIPSLQPTTFLVLITGYVFGVVPGFMVGSLAAFVSNFFLGHGPWTPWQMLGWGLVGVSGGILGGLQLKRAKLPLLIMSFLWGFLFGWLLNIWHWLAFVYPLSLKSLVAVQLTSFWFDAMHSLGNLVLMYFLGMDLIKVLCRFKRRLTISYLPEQKIERS